MNIEFYRNFIQIVENGKLSKTAEQIHIVQSALSNQLKLLEKSYGAQLLVRKPRGLELTDAGKILYATARRIVEAEETAHRDIHASLHGIGGTLRIGLTMAYPDLPIHQVLLDFHKSYPSVRYSIQERSSQEILQLLLENKLDIGFIRKFQHLPPRICEKFKISQKFQVCCAYGNPWVSPEQEQISIKDLDNVPIAIAQTYEDMLNNAFLRQQCFANIIASSVSRIYTIMLAKERACLGIVCIKDESDLGEEELFARPLVGLEGMNSGEFYADRSVIISNDHPLRPAAQTFLDFAREELEK